MHVDNVESPRSRTQQERQEKHEARGIAHKKEKRKDTLRLNAMPPTSGKARLNTRDVPTNNRSQCGKEWASMTDVSNCDGAISLEVMVDVLTRGRDQGKGQ